MKRKNIKYTLLLMAILNCSVYAEDIKYNPSFNEIKKVEKNIKLPTDENLLKFSFQILLQTRDLENAYKLAKFAVEKFPDSIYWRKNLFMVSLWTQHLDDAYESAIFLFKKKVKDIKDLEKTVYSLSLYKGDYFTISEILKKDIERGNLKKLDEFVYINTEILGNINETIDFLNNIYQKIEDKQQKFNILKALFKIYYGLDDIKNANLILNKIEEENYVGFVDDDFAITASDIYFVQKEYKKALNILKIAMPKAKDNNVDYWETLSDMAVFVKDYETTYEASKHLYKIDKFRDVDIERIYLYSKNNKEKEEILLKGWEKFKKPYYAILYINFLIETKQYEKALAFAEKTKDDTSLKNDMIFNLSLADLYYILKDYEKTKDIYLYLIAKTGSLSVKESLLWLLMEIKDKDLDYYLKAFENDVAKNKNLALVYASAYFEKQKYNVALAYLKEYIKFKGATPDLLSLYADILQAAGRDEEAENIRKQAYTLIIEKLNKEKDFFEKRENISTYLRLSIYYKTPEEFKNLFIKYKDKLEEQERKDLEILYYLRNNEQERANYLMRKYSYSQPWMLLNVALTFDDKDMMEDLLYKYINSLPTRDRVEAARRVGNIQEAFELAYEGLEEETQSKIKLPSQRSEDYQLYKQYLDLIEENSNNLTIIQTFQRRDVLDTSNTNINLYQHIVKSFYLNLNLDISYFKSTDKNTLINLPSLAKRLDIEFIKRLDLNSKIYFSMGTAESINSYSSFGFGVDYYILNNSVLGLSYNYGEKADETTYLLIGGFKEEYKLSITNNLTSKNTIYGSLAYQKFYSQDKKLLGNGKNLYLEDAYHLRQGYPDIILRNYFSYGVYNEKNCQNCSINQLSPYIDTQFLPQTFYEYGAGIIVGEVNRLGYTRVVRPFGHLTASYNNKYGIGYNFGAGIGGHIFKQDHLSVGFNIGKGFKSAKDHIYEFSISYNLFY